MRQEDFSSADGAQRIADAIRSYWFLRGHTVYAHLSIAQPVNGTDCHRRVDVRSALRNGLPPGCVWRDGKAVLVRDVGRIGL